ncbi:MAG TPA: AraC family ligand binding domain-containing protein [Gaiellaceae bacterium]|nr:AraC family ligand binding domain-containing protein [Gaiellaceae bacterium]
MAGFRAAHVDEIASRRWPYWIPVRHHFGITTFGINLWRGRDDGTVIPEHDHGSTAEPELYYVVAGHATFTVGGEQLDAPAGTCLWVEDSSLSRAATARQPGTLVLSVGAGAPGQAYSPPGWDTRYLADDG